MRTPIHLLPELNEFNEGRGISVHDWIEAFGLPDQAVGFCCLFWPDFLEREGYIMRELVNEENLRINKLSGSSTESVETMMNAVCLKSWFDYQNKGQDIAYSQARFAAEIMTEMLAAKLKRNFPGRDFSVFVIDDEDDFAVSFHQLSVAGLFPRAQEPKLV